LRAAELAVGDGALGFWGAVRDVFGGKVTEQRCWVHRTANVLDALPKRLHPQAKQAIHSIYLAEKRADAVDRVGDFADEFSAFPKAVGKITGELDTLLAFYDYPTEHWKHLRSTNAIESTFATVRLRTKVTKGSGSRRAALAMAYKLCDAAQQRWRRIDGPHLTALVRAGIKFIDGEPQERSRNDQPHPEDVAA
ncbi:MAG: transposase, partial [Deltaproteobacteria bacterium]|nr:transposase [Deltaproteobacteria bacterium]